MQTKDLTIGMLSITAVVMFVAIVLMQALAPSPVLAGGTSAAVGDYVITVGQLDDTADLIYIMDTSLQRMNVYGFNPQLGRIELVQQMDVKPRQPKTEQK